MQTFLSYQSTAPTEKKTEEKTASSESTKNQLKKRKK